MPDVAARYTKTISIHAPPVGSDKVDDTCIVTYAGFQSTLPLWGATMTTEELLEQMNISIHAPPVGSDSKDAQIWGRIFGEVFGFL